LKLSTIKHRTNKAIKKKLDVLWSQIIRKRNNGFCEVCGKPAQNSHHIVGRKNLLFRWDLRNGVNLCISCHMFGKNSAHTDPIYFIGWIQQHRKDD
jgi:5-methylcytosine-specific restriction endonuclease McrA